MSIIREDREKWGGARPYSSGSYRQFTLALSFEYNWFPLWKEKEALHQKLSYRSIAEVLNVMEYRTKTRKGVWSGKTVWQMLNP